ncbi:MAG: metallophosphoesterase family protein, partial [Clostridia bacterium]|nr:metallophosphoesterase family protein [Clostridia bacterium]
LSDLHAKRFGKKNCRLLRKISAQKPDFIAITGDIIHKYRKKDFETAAETVAALCAVAPVYYVCGNHEMRNKNYRLLRDMLRANGAYVLEDEAVEVDGITLVGVNCAHIKCGKFYNLNEDKQKFSLLLAHFPQYIDKYALAGYDLTLCGHAHGGQWRLPFIGVGFFSPGQGLFPKYTSGVHSCGDMLEIISRGLGNSQCPLRIFNRPEIVVVDLVKREN